MPVSSDIGKGFILVCARMVFNNVLLELKTVKSLGASKLVGLNMVSNENNALNTFCLQETVFNSSRTLLKTIRAQTKIKPFPMSEFMLADNVAHNVCCQIRADDDSSTCTITTG
jgi:hypothetical protein